MNDEQEQKELVTRTRNLAQVLSSPSTRHFLYQVADEFEALMRERHALAFSAREWQRKAHDIYGLDNFVESAILGTEPRSGIWTDRDYLVATLATLVGGTAGMDRARQAAVTAKPQLLIPAMMLYHSSTDYARFKREDGHRRAFLRLPMEDWKTVNMPDKIKLIVEED